MDDLITRLEVWNLIYLTRNMSQDESNKFIAEWIDRHAKEFREFFSLISEVYAHTSQTDKECTQQSPEQKK